MNVWVPFYDDLEWLKEMVASVPDGITVYAVDGRHLTFPGDTDCTPGAEAWCADRPDVIYCAPDDDRLPWGIEYAGADPRIRHPQHLKACYANYEVLPEGEWALKLDTDERVRSFEADLEALNPRMRYSPRITPLVEERKYAPLRLYVPEHWTFWLADQYFPREFYPRDTAVEALIDATATTKHGAANNGGLIESIHIENLGRDRPEAYRERRRQQLEAMGRTKRADEYRDSVT